MVVFDATMLMLLLRPESGRPIDSTTGQPIEHVAERLAHFVALHEKAKTRIGIPTPALSEVLVRAGSSKAAIQLVEKIKEFSVFEILPFDEVCAIEVAMMTRKALDTGDKQSGSDETWNKIKYDRQILAIAIVRQATALYTDDSRLKTSAGRMSMAAFGLADLPLPPEKAQLEIQFQSPPAEAANEPTLEEIDEARNAEAGPPPKDG